LELNKRSIALREALYSSDDNHLGYLECTVHLNI